MKRVNKKIFFVLIFAVFLIGKSFNVLAVNLDEVQMVKKDKIWTINFNRPVLFDDLTNENITVMNGEGQKINVILELSEDKRVVLVKPPIEGYTLDEKYTLTISEHLQSLKGRKLKKPVSIVFVIVKEIPVYIVKVNSINLTIKQGQAFSPQKKVTVDLSNGKREERDVIWDRKSLDTTKPGILILKGKVEGYKSDVILTLTIIKAQVNYNELVKASAVIGKLSRDSYFYEDSSIKSSKLGSVKKGSQVEIIKDRGYQWYYIKNSAGKYGWIQAGNLIIPKDPATNLKKLTKEQLEGYVNYKKFKSNTKYFMWVDIDHQMVYVFQGTQGKYKLLRSISCATGRNISPSVRGTFAIQNRGPWFYTGKSGAVNWVAWNRQYLFHSIIMDGNKKVIDATLGKRASAGCIRVSIDNSKWVYDYMMTGTKVWVN